jgi:hypothetical protein
MSDIKEGKDKSDLESSFETRWQQQNSRLDDEIIEELPKVTESGSERAERKV